MKSICPPTPEYIRGPIESNWSTDGDKRQFEIALPPNTTALVELPARSEDVLTEGGRPLEEAKGVELLESDATIRRLCEEAVRGGEVPGLSPAIPKNAFRHFVIDRFHGGDGQARFVVRPKVPFG